MEEQKGSDSRLLLITSICIVMSTVMSKLSLGSLLFNLPLLILAPRIKKKSLAVLTFVFTFVLITAVTLIEYKDVLGTAYSGTVLFALFFQAMAIIGSVVWVLLRDFSDSVLRKLVICSFPVAVLGIGFSIISSLPCAQTQIDALKQGIEDLFGTLFSSYGFKGFGSVFVYVLQLTVVPVSMVFSGVPIIISDLVLNKNNQRWQQNFAFMKMPDYYIWIFMASWLMVIISGFVSFPFWLTSVFWNVAFGLVLHYFVGGVSVLAFFIRKKVSDFAANKILIPLFMLCIIPGVNMLIVFGLAILGALETWIKMR